MYKGVSTGGWKMHSLIVLKKHALSNNYMKHILKIFLNMHIHFNTELHC